MKKIFTLLSFLFFSGLLLAQDGHYSRYQDAPMFTNPANTGEGEPQDIRIGINYRNQGAQGASPYRHFGAFLDYRLKNLGIGVLVNQNDTGEASFKRNQVNLSLGFHKKLSGGKNELALGVGLGFVQQQFNQDAFNYDNQYGVDGFNSLAGSGETFETTNKMLPDFSVGGNYRFQLSPTNQGFGGMVGLSFAHINRPEGSFYNDLVSFPMRTSIQAGLFFQINSELRLNPQVQWMSQQEARELLISAQANYQMDEQTELEFGLGIRKGDAFILYGGLGKKNWKVGLSYDSNISARKVVRSSGSAIELSVMVYLRKKKSNRIPDPKERDLDRDGVLDKDDLCPTIPGEIDLEGCPREENLAKGIRDIDGDGVSDDNDLCPYQPGLVRYQGCNDRDGDSVWDHLDACPSLSGSADNYGCPANHSSQEIDSDGDGVVDQLDKCVYTPGEPKLLGCPDSDHDGISDIMDHCPYIYGVKTKNGCPMEVGEARRISVEVIEFDTGASTIRSRYFPMLDRLAYELRFNENFHLQLEGHTDAEGNDLLNYQLSQRRAFAVQKYLMERGLEKGRMSITYYGESRPKATNSQEDGKQRNRRTELVLINR